LYSKAVTALENLRSHALGDCFSPYNVFLIRKQYWLQYFHNILVVPPYRFPLLVPHVGTHSSNQNVVIPNHNWCQEIVLPNCIHFCNWGKCLQIINSIGLCETFGYQFCFLPLNQIYNLLYTPICNQQVFPFM
jgi:hypothetical protein